jgi:pilus assembly protein CpaE
MAHAGFLAVLSAPEFDGLAYDVAKQMGEGSPTIVHGTLHEAARMLEMSGLSPKFLLLDLASRRESALDEIDTLAQQCEAGTRVVAIGQINDIQFYRVLTERGVPDYFPMPVIVADVVNAYQRQEAAPGATHANKSTQKLGEVYGFMSAAGGDGASTAALNAAFALAKMTGEPTVLVDLDYQYGMAARNLNLSTQYGIKDLFENPGRGIDATIVQRMVAPYGPLNVISAPSDLRFLPAIEAHTVAELIRALRQSYTNVVLDLPHMWQPWVASACRECNTFVIVAQLWLKSVSHAARILRASRDQNALSDTVRLVINRHGAKFREAIDAKDFERVAGMSISHTLANDIRTVVEAESEAKTIIERGSSSQLKTDLENLARLLKNMPFERNVIESPSAGNPLQEGIASLQSLFKLKG